MTLMKRFANRIICRPYYLSNARTEWFLAFVQALGLTLERESGKGRRFISIFGFAFEAILLYELFVHDHYFQMHILQ